MKIFLITGETTLSLWCLFEPLCLQKYINSQFQAFPSDGYYALDGILSANNSTVLYTKFFLILIAAMLPHFKQFWQLLNCLCI